jgi:hypothetical protein
MNVRSCGDHFGVNFGFNDRPTTRLVFNPPMTDRCTYEASVTVASGSCSVVVVDSVRSLQAMSVVLRTKDVES